MSNYNITNTLKKIAKSYSDVPDEIDSVYITVVNKDGSLGFIPFDAETGGVFNAHKTVAYLGNGLLRDAELIGLASELAYAKQADTSYYESLKETLNTQTDYDNYKELDEAVEEMLNEEYGPSSEEEPEEDEYIVQ